MPSPSTQQPGRRDGRWTAPPAEPRQLFTARNLIIALTLLAGALLGPLLSRIAASVRGEPPTVVFATRTPTPSPTLQPATVMATGTAAATRQSASPTAAALPSVAPTASATWTPSPEPTATLVPVPEGMVLIPPGYFQMGSTLAGRSEAPEHPVLLDAYYLDRFEVSNGDYQACVAAGACLPARIANSFTRPAYRDDPAFALYPVMGITWDDAAAYCAWAGGRLPTEAEWEYAASGPENFAWPWGNAFDPARSAAGERDTQPVEAYPEGASPFGVHNLAGNVAEWVADVYVVDFYAASPARNPVGEGSGYFRLYRGGSYGDSDGALYTTSRRSIKARNYSTIDLGFRCARSAPEVMAQMAPETQQALITGFCGLYAAYRPGALCP